MSNKRPIDWLGVPGTGGSSKRPKPPAPQPSTGSSSNPNQANWNSTNANLPGIPTPAQSSQPGTSSQGQSAGNVMLSTLRNSMRFLKKSCNVVPILDSAVDTLLEPLESMEIANQVDEELRDMASDLPRWAALLSSYLSDTRPEQLSRWIGQLAGDLVKQAEDIRKLQQRGRMKRLTNTEDEMRVLKRCYDRVEASFRQLQTDVELKTWWTADDMMKKSQLQELNPTHYARFDSTFSHEVERGECLENTRISVLEDIRSWIRGDIDAKVHWTNGMAGTGKTTIAYSVCVELERDKRLGASFFCSRTSSDCRDVGRILPTVAYQLAQQSYPFRSSLCRIINEHPNVGQGNISAQFDHLIHTPLLEVKDLLPNGLVIVIDALDECSNPKAVEIMLSTVFRHAAGLPVRFFLTSRPEPTITKRMLSPENQSRSILHLHNVEEQFVKADIETYLTVKLAGLSLNRDQIKQLAERAGILFIYAATVSRYLLGTGSNAYVSTRLRSIFAQNSQTTTILNYDIDMLYKTILDEVFSKRLERDEMELTRRVLWTVVCAGEPATKGTLAILLNTDCDLVSAALQPLQSVLHVSEESEVVSNLHASFPEFLLSSERCGMALWCNEKLHNGFMAKRCFEVMAEQLRFNICRLETSLRYDKDVPDLDDRVEVFISAELSYACRYWSNHLCRSSVCDELLAFLKELLEVNLLFWMEVINLTGWMLNMPNTLSEINKWVSGATFSDITFLVKEVYVFVTAFAANPVRQSTPHIYISALALYPKQSMVWQIYSKRMKGLIAVDGTLAGQRGRTTIWTVDWIVSSMAYSPDSSRIVFGTDKGDIHIWDAYTGAPLGNPIKSYTILIHSIALSPDNSLVAFGSIDGIVSVWHTGSGTPRHASLTGHAGFINFVVFSPNGAQLASCSGDGTIRVWGIHDGNLVHGPFYCGTGGVNCIAFSPDSALIASACGDSRIRLWDTCRGTLFVPPFKGHTKQCLCVAFSPDGTRIASGSSDGTVRVWCAYTGAPVSGPLQGTNSQVKSVAFTPDGAGILLSQMYPMAEIRDAYRGALIASCPESEFGGMGYNCVALSSHGTQTAGCRWIGNQESIVLWEAGNSAPTDILFRPECHRPCIAASADFTHIAISMRSLGEFSILDLRRGIPICAPFKGHTGQIISLAFSPDHWRITSSSKDHTVREWDVRSGALISVPFAGVNTTHLNLTYSPDGVYLLACGGDNRLRLWDTQRGELANTLFWGDGVTVLALSADAACIASGSRVGTIQAWDVHCGVPVGSAFGQKPDSIHSMVFSSNGALIAVNNYRNMVEVWEVQTGTLISCVAERSFEYAHALFLPGDAHIISASQGSVCMWDSSNGALVETLCKGDFGRIVSFKHRLNDDCLGLIGCLDYHSSAVWRFPVQRQPSSLLPHMLTVNLHGWVVDPDSRAPIFWIPAELRGGYNHIATPNTLLILRSGTFSLDFSNVLIGGSWGQCYPLQGTV